MTPFRYSPEMTPDERHAMKTTVTKEIPPGKLAEEMLMWRERAELAEDKLAYAERAINAIRELYTHFA